MASLIVSAVAKWNGSALKKGQKDLTSFQKSTLALGKAFASVFAVRKITQFGKASVQAFMADEKAAKSLEIALKNTGNGFATIATEGFIARLQDTYNVLDDELRPAFQTLLTATGSITESQKALELALSVSAGTGKDLGSVSSALAKGFLGQTTALSRLGAGLSKATLASGNMDAILTELTSKFRGQALEATKTYAGQMAALSRAAANAQEIIGKGLLDSLNAIGGGSTQNGLQVTLDLIEDIAAATAKFNFNFGTGLGQASALLRGDFKTFKSLGEEASKIPAQRAAFSPTSMYFTSQTAIRAKENAEIKKGTALKKESNKLTAAELAEKKKQAELEALKKKFDVDRINLETALANSKDEAEKARIRSLLTIMDEDANSAAKRMSELDTANAAKMKAELAAAESLRYLAQEAARAGAGLASIGNPSGVYNYTPSAPSFVYGAGSVPDLPGLSNMPEAGNPGGIYDYSPSSPSFTYSPPQVNNITINTPVGTEDYLTEAMQRALQKLNRYGDSTTFAGAL